MQHTPLRWAKHFLFDGNCFLNQLFHRAVAALILTVPTTPLASLLPPPNGARGLGGIGGESEMNVTHTGGTRKVKT